MINQAINQLLKRILSATLLLCLATPLYAAEDDSGSQLLMMRSKQSFPEAMLALQTTLVDYGYTISRVQRIDIGLTGMGYDTDKYRVLFFTKPKEFREIVAKYPELVAYLPLKTAIFAEMDETIITFTDPTNLQFIYDSAEINLLTRRWRSDIIAIMDELRAIE